MKQTAPIYPIWFLVCLFLIFLSVGTFSACKKSNSSGNSMVGALVGTTEYKSTVANYFPFNPDNVILGLATYQIAGQDTAGEMTIWVNDTVAINKPYPISPTTVGGYLQLIYTDYKNQHRFYSSQLGSDSSPQGTYTLTYFDKTAKIAKGTFSCTVWTSDHQDSLLISTGNFSISYQ